MYHILLFLHFIHSYIVLLLLFLLFLYLLSNSYNDIVALREINDELDKLKTTNMISTKLINNADGNAADLTGINLK